MSAWIVLEKILREGVFGGDDKSDPDETGWSWNEQKQSHQKKTADGWMLFVSNPARAAKAQMAKLGMPNFDTGLNEDEWLCAIMNPQGEYVKDNYEYDEADGMYWAEVNYVKLKREARK